VSFGSIPDFAFAGPGVRIGGVVAGSPAEKAGLKEGDVRHRDRRQTGRESPGLLRPAEGPVTRTECRGVVHARGQVAAGFADAGRALSAASVKRPT
jgi:hypothetical protein